MYKNDKVIRRYSEPFKLKILDELTMGKYTKSELGKLYSIAPTTINEWIRKYERKAELHLAGRCASFKKTSINELSNIPTTSRSRISCKLLLDFGSSCRKRYGKTADYT